MPELIQILLINLAAVSIMEIAANESITNVLGRYLFSVLKEPLGMRVRMRRSRI